MKIISHRCNLDGPDQNRENGLAEMRECIAMGFDVEVDVWADEKSGRLFLGHDSPEHEISREELANSAAHLWLHCKNLPALRALAENGGDLNFFWHESDAYTLTSKRIIWAYPGKDAAPNAVIVMPEWNREVGELGELAGAECYGVCTDYPVRIKQTR